MFLLLPSALPSLRPAPRLRLKARARVVVPARRSRDTAATQGGGGAPGIARLHYRVLDAQGTVLLDDYQTANGAAPATWQTLQVGLRLPQAGAVQLSVETNGAAGPTVYFDDVSVEQTGGLIVQEQHQYAFGAPLPGLSYSVGSTRYRHGYQGQFADKDEETGFDSFELRLYNSRIGRWTAPDPYGQFDSPYVGMGNDPVNGVDPDGGFFGPGPWSAGASLAKLSGLINTSYLSMGSVMLPEVLVTASKTVPGIVSLLAGGGLSILSSSRGAIMYPTKFRASHGLLNEENYSFVNTFYVAGQVFRPLSSVTNLDGSPAERAGAAKSFYGTVLPMLLTGGESATLTSETAIAEGSTMGSTSLAKIGTQFSEHALQRMAERGITPKMASTAIRKGMRFYDPKNKSFNYVLKNGFGSGKDLLIGTNPMNGRITTSIRGSNLVKGRMIPVK